MTESDGEFQPPPQSSALPLRLYTTKDAYLVVRGRAEDDTSALLLCKTEAKMKTVTTAEGRALLEITANTASEAIQRVLGRLEVEGESHVLVVTAATPVATLSHRRQEDCPVMRVDRVRALSLAGGSRGSPPSDKGLSSTRQSALSKLRSGKQALQKFVNEKIGSSSSSMVEEVLRLFNDVPDFYYCQGRDITHTTQRHFSSTSTQEQPDERFFWNRHLLRDLYEEGVDELLAREWRLPILQGFAASSELVVSEGREDNSDSGMSSDRLRVTLISRRATNRAGARYLRRGIDEDANVANFVETELVITIYDHHLSFVQVRGSVPVFWSQRGFRYRPPLSIDRPIDDSLPFFSKHMTILHADYGGPVVGVSLVDQTGRELKLATTFVEHTLRADQEWMHLFSFDFHRHCRGLNFDKVSCLVSSLEGLLSTIGFCWVDRKGEVVRRQTGVVRTNCVDCLDRTNVVQGAISQWVCMGQAMRLGLFGPLSEPPEALVAALQSMWADNGDAISRQYAGTAALKGDVTRSGERKLAGIVKDGMSSATRYYLSHVRDATRQRAINLLLNAPDQAPELSRSRRREEAEEAEEEEEEDLNENIGRLVAETTHFLLPENEARVLVGGWPLVDACREGEQVDCVVLLTRQHLYVAVYDEEAEKLEDVRIVALDEILTIEVGRPSGRGRLCLRVGSKQGAWCVRPAATRLFNNVVIGLRSGDEADEYVESIAEQLRVTLEMNTPGEWRIGRPSKLALPSNGRNARLFNMVSSVFRGGKKTDKRESQQKTTVTMETEEVERAHGLEMNAVEVEAAEAANGGEKMEGLDVPAMRQSHSEGGLTGIMKGWKGLRGSASAATLAVDPFDPFKELSLTSRSTVHFV